MNNITATCTNTASALIVSFRTHAIQGQAASLLQVCYYSMVRGTECYNYNVQQVITKIVILLSYFRYGDTVFLPLKLRVVMLEQPGQL